VHVASVNLDRASAKHHLSKYAWDFEQLSQGIYLQKIENKQVLYEDEPERPYEFRIQILEPKAIKEWRKEESRSPARGQ